MKIPLFVLGVLFILAGVAGGLFGFYLFWDGILDIVHFIRADDAANIPDSTLVWGLLRVLGVAEAIGGLLAWAGIGGGILLIAMSDD